MARCLGLEDFSVSEAGGVCEVQLEGWGLETLGWFERMIVSTFPSSGFERASEPSKSGLLGLGTTLILESGAGSASVEEMRGFLSLLVKTLTIEDSLDESHALGYHQDEDDTGGLVRSKLGSLVTHAKYSWFPNPEAPAAILEALCTFIDGHPRYRRAQGIAAVPPHEAGKTTSLCQRLLPQVGQRFGFAPLDITRVTTRAPQKDIRDDDRKKGVKRRFDNQRGSMRVDDDVKGFSVIALDDLYGSGASMAEAARALKQARAAEVLGLAMTKQRLYEGVRLATQD